VAALPDRATTSISCSHALLRYDLLGFARRVYAARAKPIRINSGAPPDS
jgi:hypothetical protein